MNTFSRLLACLLWLVAMAAGGILPARATPPAAFQLAQSAQLTVRATVDDEWLTLSLWRAGSQTPLMTKDVRVSVAGHAIPVSVRPDGTFVLPVKQLGTTSTPTVDVIVGHDGIHEVLSGTLTLKESAPASSGGHTQMIWWVVNIALVFGAAMYLTNRKKKPEAQ
jgi:hypothetical protein